MCDHRVHCRTRVCGENEILQSRRAGGCTISEDISEREFGTRKCSPCFIKDFLDIKFIPTNLLHNCPKHHLEHSTVNIKETPSANQHEKRSLHFFWYLSHHLSLIFAIKLLHHCPHTVECEFLMEQLVECQTWGCEGGVHLNTQQSIFINLLYYTTLNFSWELWWNAQLGVGEGRGWNNIQWRF